MGGGKASGSRGGRGVGAVEALSYRRASPARWLDGDGCALSRSVGGTGRDRGGGVGRPTGMGRGPWEGQGLSHPFAFPFPFL